MNFGVNLKTCSQKTSGSWMMQLPPAAKRKSVFMFVCLFVSLYSRKASSVQRWTQQLAVIPPPNTSTPCYFLSNTPLISFRLPLLGFHAWLAAAFVRWRRNSTEKMVGVEAGSEGMEVVLLWPSSWTLLRGRRGRGGERHWKKQISVLDKRLKNISFPRKKSHNIWKRIHRMSTPPTPPPFGQLLPRICLRVERPLKCLPLINGKQNY